MRPTTFAPLALATACAAALLAALALELQPPPVPLAPRVAMAASVRRSSELPLRFTPNDGRTDARVRFLAQGARHAVFFTPNEVVLAFVNDADGLALSLALVGADPNTRVEGQRLLRGRAHAMTGRDPTRWRVDQPTYGEVLYRAPWPGVDVTFRQSNGRLKWDFVVAPGASVDSIRLTYRGAEALSLDDAGNLHIQTARGVIEEPRPVTWQEVDGARVPVTSRFTLSTEARGETHVGFEVGSYDPARPLVIDPALVYSTFLGGPSADTGLAVAVGAAGHIYVTGRTLSPTFPAKLGVFLVKDGGPDAFVARIDPFADGDDSLVYATFLGGFAEDLGTGIAVDELGNAYVTGYTFSQDFPLTNGAGGTGAALDTDHEGATDAFVVKLNPSGNTLLYSTYLGGVYEELAQAVAVRTVGATHEVYVVGMTNSPDFPGAGDPPFNGGNGDTGLVDGFVAKLTVAANESATLDWGTFLGGSNDDAAFGVKVDATGHAYVVGDTRSTNFPVTPANAFDSTYNTNQDAFLAKLDTDGSCCLYATYLGGAGADVGRAVALDATGNAYLTGTAGAGFPTSAGAFDTSHNGGEDVFVARINPNAVGAASRVYATYLGGAGLDRGRAITVAPATGIAYVAGETTSATFPVTAGAIDAIIGLQDAFLAGVHPSGDAVLYGTFIGANSNEAAFGAALDPNNSDDIALTGAGQTGFHVTTSAYQPDYGGSTDAFVVSLQLAPQICLGNLARSIEELIRPGPSPCLTCPPVALRVATLLLTGEVNLTRSLVERGNTRAATLTLTRFARSAEALGRRGVLPPRPAADLGLKAAECTRVFNARR